jgi:hypothetical protein
MVRKTRMNAGIDGDIREVLLMVMLSAWNVSRAPASCSLAVTAARWSGSIRKRYGAAAERRAQAFRPRYGPESLHIGGMELVHA